MRRVLIGVTLILALGALVGTSQFTPPITAQDATPTLAPHPFVGTWVVDTLVGSDTDSPEIALVTPDGRLAGLGANRVAGGTWEAIDDHSVMLTLVSVWDRGGDGGYAVIRGPHTVDETGNTWTCECTVTIVGADGVVRDAIQTQATGRRMPVQGPEMIGTPLAEVFTWTPPVSTASAGTPTP